MAREVTISYPGGPPSYAKVTDDATGEVLQGVKAITLRIDTSQITAVVVRRQGDAEVNEPVTVRRCAIHGALEEHKQWRTSF